MNIMVSDSLGALEEISFRLGTPMYSFEELLFYLDDRGIKYSITNTSATLCYDGKYFVGNEPGFSWRNNILIAWRDLECSLNHKLYKELELVW